MTTRARTIATSRRSRAARTRHCSTSVALVALPPDMAGAALIWHAYAMRPLRYSINVTLDGCCDHREMSTDEDLHRHAAENLAQADALLFGRIDRRVRVRG